jgi:hypothetical protein
MSIAIRVAAVLTLFVFSMPAGINWRTVWLEPNPVILESPGSSISYIVKGIDGMSDVPHDLTHNHYLKVVSSDENIIAVDLDSARLVGEAVGHAEIRVSFGECTSINLATVNSK